MTSSEAKKKTSAPFSNYSLILSSVAILLVLGTVMVISASSVLLLAKTWDRIWPELLKQGFFLAVSVGIIVVVPKIPVRMIKRYSLIFFLATLVLQLLVYMPGLGHSVGNTRAWLNLGFITVQPSEFLKLGMVLALAALLGEGVGNMQGFRSLYQRPSIVLAVAVVAVMLGQDMGTGMVVAAIGYLMFFFARVGAHWLGTVALAGMAGITFLVFKGGNRIERIMQFFTSSVDGQSERAEYALGSGGLMGLGLGASREKWGYLPAANNDFIVAIIGEELGLIGILCVFVVFGLLGLAIWRLLREANDRFVALTLIGIASWILVQAAVNVAVVVGLIPVLGVPLPFLSDGGSSMLALSLAAGVLLSIARDEPRSRRARMSRGAEVNRSAAIFTQRGGRK